MSPPTPVLTRAQAHQLYAKQLDNPVKYNCTLKSLTQNECTFRVSPDSAVVQETICLPFKRIFQRCLVPYVKTVRGKKERGERWVNIEITDSSTNENIREKYGDEVKRFLRAEQDLVKWMENTMKTQQD